MATRIGTIWAQYNNWHWASFNHIITVRPNNRDITAASAITGFSTNNKPDDKPWLIVGAAGIKHVVSNGTFEEFSSLKPYIQRDNVTEIRFQVFSFEATTVAHQKIDYWN